jgi:hypothetical protein
MSEYEFFMPRLSLVFHQGELPDLIMLIPYAGFFGSDFETPFTDYDSQVILAMLVKCAYFGCQGRSTGSILAENFPSCPLLFHCFVRLLMCSLLGGYDQSEYIPPLAPRMMIYKWFSLLGYPSMGDISWFVEHNSELARLVIQEYVLYGIVQLPSLRSYLMESGYHKKVEGYAFECMDKIREVVADNMTEMRRTGTTRSGGTNWFSGISAVITKYNVLKLGYAYKPTDSSFADHVISITKSVDGAMFNTEGFMDTETGGVVESRRSVVRAQIDSAPAGEHVSYEWLSEAFKVKITNIDMLKIAEKLYVTESSTVDVKNVIYDIVRSSPWDYHVLKTFFYELVDSRKLKFYKLPESMVRGQVEALHRIYKTAPGDVLHPEAGTYYICTGCYDFKASLVEHEDDKSGEKNIAARGADRVYVDTITLEVRCSKKMSKSSKNKRFSADKSILGGAFAPGATDSAGASPFGAGLPGPEAQFGGARPGPEPLGYFNPRMIDRKLKTKNRAEMVCKSRRENRINKAMTDAIHCRSMALAKVNLVGRMLVIEGEKKVVLCPMCASPTTMKWYKYGRYGFSCKCTTFKKMHANTRVFDFAKDLDHDMYVSSVHPSHLPLYRERACGGLLEYASPVHGFSPGPPAPMVAVPVGKKPARSVRHPAAANPLRRSPPAIEGVGSRLNKDGIPMRGRGRKPKAVGTHSPPEHGASAREESRSADTAVTGAPVKKRAATTGPSRGAHGGGADTGPHAPQGVHRTRKRKFYKIKAEHSDEDVGILEKAAGSRNMPKKKMVCEEGLQKKNAQPADGAPGAAPVTPGAHGNRTRQGEAGIPEKRPKIRTQTNGVKAEGSERVLTHEESCDALDTESVMQAPVGLPCPTKNKNAERKGVCAVCGGVFTLRFMHEHRVYLEGVDEKRVVTETFCNKHDKKWLYGQEIMSLTNIRRAINEKWSVYKLEDGGVVFTTKNKKSSAAYNEHINVQ